MVPLIRNPGNRRTSAVGLSLYTRKKPPWFQWNTKLCELWSWSGHAAEETLAVAEIRPACSLGTTVIPLSILLFLA